MLCPPIYNPPLSREGKRAARGQGAGAATRGQGGAVDFLNTLERFLFVRDSGRHWGITSSFLPGSSGAAPWVPANLIVKPSIGATSMTRKRQRGRIEGERERARPLSLSCEARALPRPDID